MTLLRHPGFAITFGAIVILLIAMIAGHAIGPAMAERLSEQAGRVIAEAGGKPITAQFISPGGMPSRHPLLSGGEDVREATRARVAKAVAAIPGVGGVRWSDGGALVENATEPVHPLHCQNDVEALLRARTIRFEESSSRIDNASGELLDEVAAALRPCLGSIIAITGHTDSSGPEPGNIALSGERADAVRAALVQRGIPADGLRVRGVGSREPVPGLEPGDPANRRIDFSVVATEAIRPTPVDTPGPR